MKRSQRFLCQLFALAALYVAASATAAGPSIEAMANTCAMCHSAEGKGAIEKLDGMSASEFRKEMLEFRREGKGRIMATLVKAYTEEEIRQLADHFQKLPKPRGGKR